MDVFATVARPAKDNTICRSNDPSRHERASLIAALDRWRKVEILFTP